MISRPKTLEILEPWKYTKEKCTQGVEQGQREKYFSKSKVGKEEPRNKTCN